MAATPVPPGLVDSLGNEVLSPTAATPVPPGLVDSLLGGSTCRSSRISATPVLLLELVDQEVRGSAGWRR